MQIPPPSLSNPPPPQQSSHPAASQLMAIGQTYDPMVVCCDKRGGKSRERGVRFFSCSNLKGYFYVVFLNSFCFSYIFNIEKFSNLLHYSPPLHPSNSSSWTGWRGGGNRKLELLSKGNSVLLPYVSFWEILI
nr:hypothetical protein [Morchella crassipes]